MILGKRIDRLLVALDFAQLNIFTDFTPSVSPFA
jgi:hypothetical protein